MSYHIFRKRDSQSVFSTKKEKIKSKSKSQNRKECHDHCTISIALHCCIQSLHLLYFKIKVACICIPKIIFISAQTSLKDKRPSQRINLLFSHKIEPFGTSVHWLASKDSKFSPSKDSKSSPLKVVVDDSPKKKVKKKVKGWPHLKEKREGKILIIQRKG